MENVSIEERKAVELSGEATTEMLFQLGLMYALGRGVDCDKVNAHKWFNLAAAQGCPRARAERAALADEMSPDEVIQAQKQARAWATRIH